MLRYAKMSGINCDREKLMDIFHEHKHRTNYYVSNSEEMPVSSITWADVEKPDYIKELESNFNFFYQSYFIMSSGYWPHVDDTRQCLISFEIQNENNVPLKFYDPDEEAIHPDPKNGAIMWNPQALHGSESSPTQRIFYQIELEDDKPFEFYVEKYINEELLK